MKRPRYSVVYTSVTGRRVTKHFGDERRACAFMDACRLNDDPTLYVTVGPFRRVLLAGAK